MAATQSFNLAIPHLKPEQKVRDWRALYTAATSLLTEPQKIGHLPIAVDRSLADQKWASEATKKVTLKEALDELELRLDGKKTRFQAMKDFFNLKAGSNITPANVSDFFFSALEAGKAATLSNDVIAIKFLQDMPGGSKLFADKEEQIKTDMTEDDLIKLFDYVKEKLQKKAKIKTEEHPTSAFVAVENEPVPRWARDLREQVAALESAIQSFSSTDSGTEEQNRAYYAKKEGKKFKRPLQLKPCGICGKNNHTEQKCFKRVCSNCSGTGHDAGKCSTRGANRRR